MREVGLEVAVKRVVLLVMIAEEEDEEEEEEEDEDLRLQLLLRHSVQPEKVGPWDAHKHRTHLTSQW